MRKLPNGAISKRRLRKEVTRGHDGIVQGDPDAGQAEARLGSTKLPDRPLQGTQGLAVGSGAQPKRFTAETVPRGQAAGHIDKLARPVDGRAPPTEYDSASLIVPTIQHAW